MICCADDLIIVIREEVGGVVDFGVGVGDFLDAGVGHSYGLLRRMDSKISGRENRRRKSSGRREEAMSPMAALQKVWIR